MHDLNVLALFKGDERFIFVYDDASRTEVVAAIRDTAADAGTAFNWFDAAVLTERAEQQAVAVTATGDFDDSALRDDAP
jgi:hypothetical protein